MNEYYGGKGLFHGAGFSGASHFLWCIVLFIGALAALFAYLACSLNSVRFVVSPQGFRIRALLYGRTIQLAALDVQKARVLDLAKDQDYRPAWRNNGLHKIFSYGSLDFHQ